MTAHRLWLAAALAFAAGTPALADTKPDAPKNTATLPTPKTDGGWKNKHENFVKIASQGGADVLFLGDSITEGWKGNGKEVWKERFGPLKAVNFGISGDRTENVLWRLTEGKELEGIEPKACVLMIGTNNLSPNKIDADITAGVTAVVKELHARKPKMKVLLLGIFPRGEKADDKSRGRIKGINADLAKLDDGKYVFFKDIGEKFLVDKDGKPTDGKLDKAVMNDFLHLTPAGYKIWADAVEPDLKKLLEG